jgi:hypothetical protein
MLYPLAYTFVFVWASLPSELRVLGNQVKKIQVKADETVVN